MAMTNIMKDIATSEVSDKDIMDWLRDYAVPRIRVMRAMDALRNMAEPVVQTDKIPGFVMPTNEYGEFRKLLNSVAKSESLAFAFEPETRKEILMTGRFGTLFGFMPVIVKKDELVVRCFASEDEGVKP